MSALVDEIHAALLISARGGDTPSAAWVRREARRRSPLAADAEIERIVAEVESRRSGLGRLDPLLADERVSDVLVNGDGCVWIERDGELIQTELRLEPSDVLHVIERIVGPLGLRVDRSAPTADARLPDGARVNVVVPPLAVDGPCITIRRFGTRTLPLEAMCSPPVAALLAWAVRARANVLVTGGTGAGKTTLLNALAHCVSPCERVVTVEDAAELRLPLPHVVRLEARPPSAEGVEAVTIRDLVRNALRMRPDRLIVGEVRGGEALEMLQAMNTGHDGSLSTCHANSAADALRRVETMVLLSGVPLPLAAVRDQIGAALDLVVHVARGRAGARRVVAVEEVCPGRRLVTRPIADADGVHALPTRGDRGSTAPVLDPIWLESGTCG